MKNGCIQYCLPLYAKNVTHDLSLNQAKQKGSFKNGILSKKNQKKVVVKTCSIKAEKPKFKRKAAKNLECESIIETMQPVFVVFKLQFGQIKRKKLQRSIIHCLFSK